MPSSSPVFFENFRLQIDHALKQTIQAHSQSNSRLAAAMSYSTLLGGKRVRPILVLATAECFQASTQNAMPVACAVELIHAYSLIHDDLPAMDNDDLRRGQPTCHRAYDEATAILAGDGLQALAFELLADENNSIPANNRLRIIKELARAAGARGMVAGQAIDLESVGKGLSLDQLQQMHQLKTGALITASVLLGALCSNEVDEEELAALRDFADAIGLGFQVQDDILDITSNTEVLGKTQGADMELNKPTYPALLGLEGARQKLKELSQAAHDALDRLPNRQVDTLRQISDFIVKRDS